MPYTNSTFASSYIVSRPGMEIFDLQQIHFLIMYGFIVIAALEGL